MRLSSFLFGAVLAVVVIAVLLLVSGVTFERAVPSQGAALYNPANEVVLRGVVQETQDFACPVSEGEVGSHLMLQTADGVVQVHLAPGRIMRSQNISFVRGEQVAVVGSRIRFRGKNDLIAREITRGNESLVFRDHAGKLMLVQ